MPVDNDFTPALEAAARTARAQRDQAPCIPTSLHWLGDREAAEDTGHALDVRGCVMYFERQSDCLNFMRWLERQARS